MSIMRILITAAAILFPAKIALAQATRPAEIAFEPGVQWLDDQGKPINAHGGGILNHQGTYYWFGEHKVHRGDHAGVGCYSSSDLFHWKNQSIMLSAGPVSDIAGDLVDGCVIERPKVLFNAKTKKFVMWFHLELRGQGYAAARAAVAVSDSVTGPYTYVGSFRPNAGVWPTNFPKDLRRPLDDPKSARRPDDYVRRDFKGGQMSRDMNLFVDDDGSAWQIYSSEENATLQISRLGDDYLKPAGEYFRVLVGGQNEAPVVFKRHGKYYLLTSGTTGWAPNAARLAVADRLSGPWKSIGNPCVGHPKETATTFRSQPTCVLAVPGKSDDLIYIGDRWKARDLPDSRYIWLPIQFEDDRMSIAWKSKWTFASPSQK